MSNRAAGLAGFGAGLLGVPLLLLALPAAGQDPNVSYATNNDGTFTVYAYTGGAVTVPGTFGARPITVIGYYTFEYVISLTNVTLPRP